MKCEDVSLVHFMSTDSGVKQTVLTQYLSVVIEQQSKTGCHCVCVSALCVRVVSSLSCYRFGSLITLCFRLCTEGHEL